MSRLRRDGRLTPAAFAVGYLLVGLLWIVGTDAVVAAVDVGRLEPVPAQTVKGAGFVAASALLLYVLLRRRERIVAESYRSLDDVRRRFESVVRASPVPIVALDADGRVQLWNEAAADVFGWSESEAVGERMPIVPEDRTGEFRSLLDRVLDGETVANRELERVDAEGRSLVLSLSAAPIYDSAGAVEGVMAVLRDVTERKAREQSLAEYRDLVDHLPVGVFRTAPRGRDEFVEVNPAMVAMFDADSAAQLLSRPLSGLYADPTDMERLFADLAESEEVTDEIRFETLSGDVFWARITAIERETEGGTYVEGIMQDVTERKEHERQLAVLDRVLRHNLRNKMCVIQGRADDIAAWGDGEVARAARQIREQGESLLGVARDQRTIVELVADPPDRTPIDLRAVVERQVAAARERHPDAAISVAAPDAATVAAIEDVDRAVGELVENAIKHSDRSAPRVWVVVEGGARPSLVVADDGPGIPDPEVGVLTHEQDIGPLYHGSGMGLWLVRWIVRLSDGTLTFADNEPRGSVVRIDFERP